MRQNYLATTLLEDGQLRFPSEYLRVGPNSDYDTVNDRLGINTLTPLAGLHIDKTSNSTNPHMLLSVAGVASTGNDGGYAKWYNGTAVAGNFSPFLATKCRGASGADRAGLTVLSEPGFDDAGSSAIILRGALNGSALTLSPLLSIRNLTTEYLTLLPNGRLGLGTLTPERTLHVLGNGILSERSDGSPQLVLRRTQYTTADWRFDVGTDGIMNVKHGTSDLLRFKPDLSVGINTLTSVSGTLTIGANAAAVIAFHGAVGADQAAFIAAPTAGMVIDTEARTAINLIRTLLSEKGLMAAA